MSEACEAGGWTLAPGMLRDLRLKKAEEAMAARMVEACNDLESTGKTIFGNV